MKAYQVDLKEQGYNLQGGVLSCILMDEPFDRPTPEWTRPAVIVVPGGGYGMVSKREGEPIASFFLARGYQVFVLTYLCQPQGARYPEQFLELAAAVDYVKKHAKECRVDPEEVFAVGFSAGGHLTATLATLHGEAAQLMGADLDCKPAAVGLSYPVISPEGHRPSLENLLCGYDGEEKAALMQKLTLDLRVNADTVPSFIWTTAEDRAVDPKDSLRFATALQKAGVPFELHVYPKAGHGISTADFEVNGDRSPYMRRNARWMQNCDEFFRMFIKQPF